MDILDDIHVCPHCQGIELDGTGPDVKQRFEFSCSDVRAFAAVCLLFRWCLNLLQGKVVPEPNDRLVFSICEGSEDIAYLDVDWKNEFGQALFTDNFYEYTSLHIFAKEGTSCLFI